jgi:hypothetical protein
MDLNEVDDAMFLSLIEYIAQNGTQVLPQNRNHEVNGAPKIIQLTAGGNAGRLLYFFDREKHIIICAAFKKRGGKSGQTDRTIVKAAVKLHDAYFEARSSNAIEWIE